MSLQERIQKYVCLEYDNHSRPNSQHNWEEPTWPFNEHENHDSYNEQDIPMSSENNEEKWLWPRVDELAGQRRVIRKGTME